jgi:HK97 family phage prohead protease
MDTKFKSAGDATMEDGGSVKGYASTFDRIPDSYGDVIAKGAFADSLKHWEEIGKPIPLLYGHSTDDPKYNIGKVTKAYEDERGLYVEAEFDAENETAQYVRKLAKEGRLYQFSFAYEVLDWDEVELEDGTKANELRKLNLFEVSLVQIPANQRAEVTEVKDAKAETKSGRRNSKADEDELRRIRALAEDIASAIDGLISEAVTEDSESDSEAEGGDLSAQAQSGDGQADSTKDDGFEAYKQEIIERYI